MYGNGLLFCDLPAPQGDMALKCWSQSYAFKAPSYLEAGAKDILRKEGPCLCLCPLWRNVQTWWISWKHLRRQQVPSTWVAACLVFSRLTPLPPSREVAFKEAAEMFLGGYLDVFLGHKDDSPFNNYYSAILYRPCMCMCVGGGVISVLHNASELLRSIHCEDFSLKTKYNKNWPKLGRKGIMSLIEKISFHFLPCSSQVIAGWVREMMKEVGGSEQGAWC